MFIRRRIDSAAPLEICDFPSNIKTGYYDPHFQMSLQLHAILKKLCINFASKFMNWKNSITVSEHEITIISQLRGQHHQLAVLTSYEGLMSMQWWLNTRLSGHFS